MYAPSAAGALRDRPVRARAKITSSSPSVATTSERKCGPEARCLVDTLTADTANMTLATIDPKAASTTDTTGLMWAPEIGPNIKMMANSPDPVATAFSSNSSPGSPGESCWAAIPEPITTAARNALPSPSASNRRHSGCFSITTPAARGSLAASAAHRPERVVGMELTRGHLHVGQHGIELPRFPAGTVDPHLVLQGVAARDFVLDRGRQPGRLKALLGGGNRFSGLHLDPEVVERPRHLASVLDEDQLEGRVGDGEVGVAGPDLGRLGVEQRRVEADRLVHVGDVEGELHAGHLTNLLIAFTYIDISNGHI